MDRSCRTCNVGCSCKLFFVWLEMTLLLVGVGTLMGCFELFWVRCFFYFLFGFRKDCLLEIDGMNVSNKKGVRW